jgi:hypothetical protein
LGTNGEEEMSEDTSIIDRRVKRAAKLLFYKRHRQPGVKGWELRRNLGGDYSRIIELLNERLEDIDLQVIVVKESETEMSQKSVDLDSARFYISLKGSLSTSDLVMSGWRVDDVATLIVVVALITSREGKLSRRDVEAVLREKFAGWRVDYNLNRFIRMGYLSQDEQDVLFIGWRSRAEIDEKLLVKLILGEPMVQEKRSKA